MKRAIISIAAAMLALSVHAQTNIQTFYDFGSDRHYITTTVEMFKADSWGNTFFFIDHDYNFNDPTGHNVAPGGSYMEIARCLNFWQNSALASMSLQVEYNGGLGIYGVQGAAGGYGINNAFLIGVDYFAHSSDFSNTLNLKVLYKNIVATDQKLPLQLTAVWSCNRLLGLDGLQFSGFADFWWEEGPGSTVFSAEPQLWYNVGRHFGCSNLSIGSEVELAYNFIGIAGFRARPCLGFKWMF